MGILEHGGSLPTNVEVKARARHWDLQMQVAEVGARATILEQEDTFFRTERGRLKLREIRGGQAYLIYYERPDESGSKVSEYRTADVSDPEAEKALLAAACGVTKTVKKVRRLFLHGQTRLHFDEVEGLGRFIEIEVCLAPGQSVEEGRKIAADWTARLSIQPSDLVSSAYADLLPT